jgi:hypothetical protein
MTSSPNGAPRNWDSRQEERQFAQLEQRFGRELIPDANFPKTASHYPLRLASLMSALAAGYSNEFVADVISACNCICLRTWREYVKEHWKRQSPEAMLEMLQALPNLRSFLNALETDSSLVTRYPRLAKEDLVARNAYANGGRWEDYYEQYGCKIQAPQPSLAIIPQSDSELFKDFLGKSSMSIEPFGSVSVEDDNPRSSIHRFHLCESFSIGRQKGSKEPNAFGVLFGRGEHRLIIADHVEPKVASREQIRIVVLTPQFLYLKNTSSAFRLDVHSLRGSIKLDFGESCITPSDVTIRCNSIRIEVVPIQKEQHA